MIRPEDIKYVDVKEPFFGLPSVMPELSEEVYKNRLDKTLAAMADNGYDYLLIYADREDYGNFKYLAGFEPRFEEAALLLAKDGKAQLLLGNECLNMQNHSKIDAEGILYQSMSLPNQPMDDNRDIDEILLEVGVSSDDKFGIVGWKLIYPVYGDQHMFDIPSFMVDGVRKVVDEKNILNATDLFIHPEYGVRVTNSAEEIALFEYGAAYASDSVQKQLLKTRTGMSEVEISQYSTIGSLPTSCFPKVLSGHRVDIGMASCNTKIAELGDKFQITVGLVGGQTNRRGFLAYSEEDLPEESRDWLEVHAKPYFAISANWFENIGLDVKGKEIYDMVEENYPKEKFGWFLNPGHLIAEEEWMSSPIYPESDIQMKSGMVFQMDIIPFVDAKYVAPDLEDGIALADEELRKEIEEKFPEVYERIQKRRDFMINVLNINLKPEVLPLSNITGLYRPYMLNKDKAFIVGK